MRRLRLLAIVACLLFWGPAVGAARADDPPRIVPWHLIGNVGLGMSRTRVEYVYGRGSTLGELGETHVTYLVHGGALIVDYARGYVENISTTSPYYRTADGVGVGSRIPLGRCQRVSGRCRHTWRGLTLRHTWRGLTLGNGESVWRRDVRRGKRTVDARLWVERGRVTAVAIGFWDRSSPGYACGVDPSC